MGLRVRAVGRPPSSGGIAIGIAPTPVPSMPDATFSAMDAFPELGSRYRVEKKLGEGGMGAVYKAWDKDLDRYVAVKLMRKELVSHPESLMRFKQELLLASKISHRNILRIYDLADAAGTKFFTMAFVDGEDLASVIAREGAMPVERAVEIGLQICAALVAAHHEGVVHRDLKPENILVDRQTGQIYVSDFGLSTSVENVNATRLTVSGQSIGTPRYMSPEQVQSKPVDQRSDLYAFGLILYEMLTAQAPFAGNSVFEQMFQRVQNTPKPPSEFRPGLPAYIQNVVLRCLEREPENRYQSAEEIERDLKAQQAAEVKVRPDSKSITFTMPQQPKKVGALALAGVLGVGAIGSAGYWYVHRNGPRGGMANLTRVAVLPFQTVGDDPQLHLMAEGFHDSLTANLGQLQQVNVSAAPQGAIKPGDTVAQIAKKLGVQYVVTGTLQGASDRIRLGVKVEDASGKAQPWTYSQDGVPGDILTLEDTLLTRVTDALKVHASADEVARSTTHSTADLNAYDLYLKGKDAQRGDTLKDTQSAVDSFGAAVKADPKFALGYAGLATASLQMYLRTKDTTWAQRAIGAAQQARSLDPNLPEAHIAAANIYSNTGRSSEAIAELQSALKLAPNSDEGYRRLAQAYASASRKDDAIQAAKHSIELNPYFWVNYNQLGSLYNKFGEYDKALEQFRKVTELDSTNAVGYRNIGIALFAQGKIADCIEPLKKSLGIEPSYEGYSNLATAYFYQRNYSGAVEMYKKALELNPRDQQVTGNLADAYRAMGQQTQADQMYRKAIELAGEQLKVNPKDADTLSAMALSYAKMGDSIHALPLLERARKIDPNNATLLSDEAIVDTLVGRMDDAFSALDAAFAHGYAVEDADGEPELAQLRNDPRYKQVSGKYRK